MYQTLLIGLASTMGGVAEVSLTVPAASQPWTVMHLNDFIQEPFKSLLVDNITTLNIENIGAILHEGTHALGHT